MATLKSTVGFDNLSRTVSFPSETLNFILNERVYDSLDIYQRRFEVFAWLRLNTENKFVLHTISGSPFLWQDYDNCSFTPAGELNFGEQELTPCRAKVNLKKCHDAMFRSCFKQLLNYSGGSVRRSQAANRIFAQMMNVISQNMALGARKTLLLGRTFSLDTVKLKDNVPNNLKEIFDRTMGTCQGLLELLKELALAGHTHLNDESLITEGDFSNGKYTGDIVALYDRMLDRASPELQNVVDEGGLMSIDNTMLRPLFLLSTPLFKRAKQQYKQQCVPLTCVNVRLERETEMVAGVKRHWYTIDDVPIIPLHDLCIYDRYLQSQTFFAALTVAKNFGLGGSFAGMPTITGDRGNIGMKVQLKTDVDEEGIFVMAAHALFATFVHDSKLAVAVQRMVEVTS